MANLKKLYSIKDKRKLNSTQQEVIVMSEIKAGCARPELTKPEQKKENVEQILLEKKEEQKMIRVGKPAPSFTAPAFYGGQFINVNLDDYKGKWVLLCFYPGDFTFV